MDFLASFLDPKKAAPISAALATILVQLAASREWALDAHTADALSTAFVTLALAVAASHAHVEHAETHADATVKAAEIASTTTPAPSKN
jgi:hypothetical protein